MNALKIILVPNDEIRTVDTKSGNKLHFHRVYVDGVGDFKFPVPIDLPIKETPKSGTYTFENMSDVLTIRNDRLEVNTFGLGDQMLKMTPSALPPSLASATK